MECRNVQVSLTMVIVLDSTQCTSDTCHCSTEGWGLKTEVSRVPTVDEMVMVFESTDIHDALPVDEVIWSADLTRAMVLLPPVHEVDLPPDWREALVLAGWLMVAKEHA